MVTLKRLPYPGTPLTVGTDSSAVLYYTLLLQRIAYLLRQCSVPRAFQPVHTGDRERHRQRAGASGLPATGVADAETWTAVEA